jgi:transposase-like protein
MRYVKLQGGIDHVVDGYPRLKEHVSDVFARAHIHRRTKISEWIKAYLVAPDLPVGEVI